MKQQAISRGKAGAHGHGDDHPHVLSAGVLLGTGGTLLVLTVVTVVAARQDFGRLNLVIALAIATLKASLVAAFFMHLKYENRFYLLVLASSLVFLAVMVGLIVFATTHYQQDIRAYEERAVAAATAAPPPAASAGAGAGASASAGASAGASASAEASARASASASAAPAASAAPVAPGAPSAVPAPPAKIPAPPAPPKAPAPPVKAPGEYAD
ncbi:MAG: cytochrome C oxidase subunit IV family protein [Myxococcales bacterium]|nr:cytochrome C oxidase subunit IV family protein [Myxococcales bacterium]